VESIPVIVVHLRPFFDKFVKFPTNERREVEVVLLDPLGLVFADGDVLPSHYIRTMRICAYGCCDCVGLWAERRTCLRTVRRCIPSLLTRSARSLRKGLSASIQVTRLKPVFSIFGASRFGDSVEGQFSVETHSSSRI